MPLIAPSRFITNRTARRSILGPQTLFLASRYGPHNSLRDACVHTCTCLLGCHWTRDVVRHSRTSFRFQNIFAFKWPKNHIHNESGDTRGLSLTDGSQQPWVEDNSSERWKPRVDEQQSWQGERQQRERQFTQSDTTQKRPKSQSRDGKGFRFDTYQARLRRDPDDVRELMSRKFSGKCISRMQEASPSLYLEEALALARNSDLLPRPRPESTHDLSYRHARDLKAFNTNAISPSLSKGRVSLQSITASQIRRLLSDRVPAKSARETAGKGPNIGMQAFSSPIDLCAAEQKFLRAAGYTWDDVSSWASALLQPDVDQALDVAQRTGTAIPWFLANFLLRRKRMSVRSLKRLCSTIGQILSTRKQSAERLQEKKDFATNNGHVSLRMIMIACVRLCRHAHDLHPPLLGDIAEMFTANLLRPRDASQLNPSLLSELSFKCNRMLSQLSLGGKSQHLVSASTRRNAIFQLIRSMTFYSVPIPLTREGHRALTKSLLACKKTETERDWAELKRLGWPPFKVSRIGLDDTKDRAYGTSVGGLAIRFMQAYGYSKLNWDIMCEVHTGWNPDGTPSIQRRASITAVPTSFAGEPQDRQIHAAMILSTRTVPEAWAIFTKYDTADGYWSPIYMSIFQVLLNYENRHRRRPDQAVHPDNLPAVPGDAREVSSPPLSPRDTIYLASEPPSSTELLDQLLQAGVTIHGKFMLTLLELAPNLSFGLRVWHHGKLFVFLGTQTKMSSRHHYVQPRKKQRPLSFTPEVPEAYLHALIALLLRFPGESSSLNPVLHPITSRSLANCLKRWTVRDDTCFAVAFHLLDHYRPSSTSFWNLALSALATQENMHRLLLPAVPRRFQMIPLWDLASEFLRRTRQARARPNQDTLHHIASIVWGAALAGKMLGFPSMAPEEARISTKLEGSVASLRSRGAFVLRKMFLLVADGDRSESTTRKFGLNPDARTTHVIVSAPILHQYVRALGILEEHEGIYSFTMWLDGVYDQLLDFQMGHLNGELQLRRLMVSIRVFLECPSRDFVLAERKIEIAPAQEDLLEFVKTTLSKRGLWASDEEVDHYCTRHENYALAEGQWYHPEVSKMSSAE